MLSKKEQDRLYYLKHREERIAYSKKCWEEKAKAYNEPDLEGEEWKPLTNYEAHYQTSNMGRIKSVWHMKVRIINGAADKDGYRKITLTDDTGRQRTFRKCKIIAQEWIPNPDNKPELDHINTVRDDDRVCNLRWVTSKENKANPLTRKNMSTWQKGKTKEEVRRKQL